MIRAAIICPDQDLAGQFQQALSKLRDVGIARVLHQYPNEAKLPAFLKASTLELIFLSAENARDAADVAARIEAQAPGTPIVAIHRSNDGPTMLQVLRAGCMDFLALPFESKTLAATLERVTTMLSRKTGYVAQPAPVFAFLPAKAGAGTTTIVVNTSLAMASMPDKRVLLIDLDLNSGLVAFMLSIKPQFSITDAADNAPDMDETIWSKLVTSVGNLDVLPAGFPQPGLRIEGSQIRRILEFAERNYDVIFVDLSGMMERYAVEVLRHAKQVILVCTPEVPSLHLARAKLELLRQIEVDEQIGILINRVEKGNRTIPVAEMEGVLHKKVFFTLPNAYDVTRKATISGKRVEVTSELGMSYAKLAQTMLPAPEPVVEQRRGFLDAFRTRKNAPARMEDHGLGVKALPSRG